MCIIKQISMSGGVIDLKFEKEAVEQSVPKQENISGKVSKKRSPAKQILFYLHDIVYFIAFAIVILLLCFRVVVVSGDSMKNTLVDGDMLLLLGNTFYQDPQPGDIIVASKESFRDGEPIIKRVIAVEGQTVDINFANGVVTVDGEIMIEPYIRSITTNHEGLSFPQTVPEGCVFVLGDNRIRSKDSRSPEIGMIDKREILGKGLLIAFPGKGKADNRDFDRIGVMK